MAEGLMPVPDAVRDVLKMVIGGEVESILADNGFTQATSGDKGESDRHAAFKKIMEKLRNMPHLEAMRKLDRYFIGLTPEDRAVLEQLVKRTSLQSMSDAARIPMERFAEIKHDLQNKIQ
jgi:hypothetical protein